MVKVAETSRNRMKFRVQIETTDQFLAFRHAMTNNQANNCVPSLERPKAQSLEAERFRRSLKPACTSCPSSSKIVNACYYSSSDIQQCGEVFRNMCRIHTLAMSIIIYLPTAACLRFGLFRISFQIPFGHTAQGVLQRDANMWSVLRLVTTLFCVAACVVQVTQSFSARML